MGAISPMRNDRDKYGMKLQIIRSGSQQDYSSKTPNRKFDYLAELRKNRESTLNGSALGSNKKNFNERTIDEVMNN